MHRPADDPFTTRAHERELMVRIQIDARGAFDPTLLDAFRRVPRHEFVPERSRTHAYDDRAVSIGYGQTISQPYIVAVMTRALDLTRDHRVLEIGTGSGYQTAILAELVDEVYSIEYVPELARRARATLDRLGYAGVHLRCGDGYRGWPEHAPFDAVIVTAAPIEVPRPLLDQLAVGGKLVAPVGDRYQQLVVWTRRESGIVREPILPVNFVPMEGEARG